MMDTEGTPLRETLTLQVSRGLREKTDTEAKKRSIFRLQDQVENGPILAHTYNSHSHPERSSALIPYLIASDRQILNFSTRRRTNAQEFLCQKIRNLSPIA
jgi:hypothetical protein